MFKFFSIKKITDNLIFLPMFFRCLVPFIGFLFLASYHPEYIGWLAGTSWLAVLLYVYFLVGRYAKNLQKSKIDFWLGGILVPLILFATQFFRPEFSLANYFVSLTLLEVVTVGLGLFLFFLLMLGQAAKDDVLFVVLLAALFIGCSGVGLLLPFLLLWGELNETNIAVAFWSLLLAFSVNIFNEIKWLYVFRKNKAKNVGTGFSDYVWDENPMLIIGLLLFWSFGIPLIWYTVG